MMLVEGSQNMTTRSHNARYHVIPDNLKSHWHSGQQPPSWVVHHMIWLLGPDGRSQEPVTKVWLRISRHVVFKRPATNPKTSSHSLSFFLTCNFIGVILFGFLHPQLSWVRSLSFSSFVFTWSQASIDMGLCRSGRHVSANDKDLVGFLTRIRSR